MNWRATALFLAASTAAVAAASETGPKPSASARSDYIEYCGGCHGIGGSSAPARVPQLKGRAGYFLCTPRGREYLVRLPNVARAPVTGDAALADLVNYVAFDLGGDETRSGWRRFDAAEVADLRGRPFTTESLIAERKAVVREILKTCRGAPADLARAF